MNLEGFGVKNLRSLTDTGVIDLRPITLLVGRNSSGKSTFLRAFPLLRQSVETRRNSPILWQHDRYVDFGSLVDASNHELSEPTVTFGFSFRMPKAAQVTLDESIVTVEMTLAGRDVPYVRTYEICVEGHQIRWDLDARGRLERLTANGEVIPVADVLSLGGKAHLLPTLQRGEGLVAFQQAVATADVSRFDYQTTRYVALLILLLNRVQLMVGPKASPDAVSTIADRLRMGSSDAMAAWFNNETRFIEYVEDVGGDDGEFKDIVAAAAAYHSPHIIEATDLILASIMSRVVYLKPLRVNPERSYPRQNFAVDEVDPDGRNLAMFLSSLSAEEAANFASFTAATLGFETAINPTKLRVEILIKEGQAKRFVNLVDVGFGYSEVLPLAAVLWTTCIRPSMHGQPSAPIVAIEQPELHLHPAAQSKLARMFADAAKGSQGSKLIIETHSESLINGLGKLIYERVLSADDVQIVLFDKDDETGQTEVSRAGYRDNGALHDWPYGFLSPVGERRVPSSVE